MMFTRETETEIRVSLTPYEAEVLIRSNNGKIALSEGERHVVKEFHWGLISELGQNRTETKILYCPKCKTSIDVYASQPWCGPSCGLLAEESGES